MNRADATPLIDLGRTVDREHLLLASYATHSADSRGRLHAEPSHPYRGPFARDRDRILHSSAFRRLAGKMQVFTGEFGVYHRTRLTHTMEVASIARTIARTLRLNEDLTEALALMHDIGHPPYGHCGEDALAERMAEVGGFSHNGFALTIVTELEQRYQDFPGLNLSAELLAGQDVRAHKVDAAVGRAPPLEVQVVDLADSIAYDAHDIDDAIQMGLLSIDELAGLSLIRRLLERIRHTRGRLPLSQLRQLLVHELVDTQVSDLLDVSVETLARCDGRRSADICAEGIRLRHGEVIAAERGELESFLFETVYRHPRLMPVREAAANRVRTLFDRLAQDPSRLPLRFRTRSEHADRRRVVGEYLAGATDQFCDQQYEYVLASDTGPLSDW